VCVDLDPPAIAMTAAGVDRQAFELEEAESTGFRCSCSNLHPRHRRQCYCRCSFLLVCWDSLPPGSVRARPWASHRESERTATWLWLRSGQHLLYSHLHHADNEMIPCDQSVPAADY
jgi:hypothetical protein